MAQELITVQPTVEVVAEAIFHATHGRDTYSFALSSTRTQDRCRAEARAVLALFPGCPESAAPSRFTYACPHCAADGRGYKLTAPTLDGRTVYLCLTCKRVSLATAWVTDAKDGGQ